MIIDFEKKVKDLTPQEAIYLGKKASGQIDKEIAEKQYQYQEYPKYIPEFNARVLSAEEEEELRKSAKIEAEAKAKAKTESEAKKLDNK